MGGEVPLGTLLADVEVGIAGGTQTKAPADGEWGVLRLSAMSSGLFTSEQAKRLTAQGSAPKRLEVRDGDVLMVRVNGAQHLVGAARSVRGARPGLLLSDLLFRIVPDEERLLPGFLDLLLNSHDVRRQMRRAMRGSSGQFQLPQTAVKALMVPDVPLEEQRRIVAAHAAFERRIGTLEHARAKLNAARAGMLNDLVAGPLIPLGKVLADKPKNGYSPSEVPEWTGLQALGLGCLTAEGFVPRQLKRVPNTPLARRYLLEDGDLVMSRANTRELVGLAGRYQDVGHPCIYPDLMMRLRPDETQCLTPYLELALHSGGVRSAVQAAARGTSESMVKISAAVVEGLRVPLPDVGRQAEIVSAIAAVDQRMARQTAMVAKLRVIQQAVVEDLLTGHGGTPAA